MRGSDELVARAAAMRDTVGERQAQCEAEGRLPDETNREYVEAGFFRVLQPRRFGGFELGLETFLRIAIELSRGCPSSGWVYALTAGHAHTVTMWPEQGQVDPFGDGEFRCPFSNLPARAVRADGGYRVDGWWDYGSGCDIATHFIGGVAVAGDDGQQAVDTRWAGFPRAALPRRRDQAAARLRARPGRHRHRPGRHRSLRRAPPDAPPVRAGLAPAPRDRRALDRRGRHRVPHRGHQRHAQGRGDRALLPRRQHDPHPRDDAVRSHVRERRPDAPRPAARRVLLITRRG